MNLESKCTIASLLLASVHDALSLAIIMIFRVFSPLLDPEKTWYALNDRLCAKSPRKFGENNLFGLFPDEIRSLNIGDLHDSNGGPALKQWFNKLDGRKGADHVYVASAFAILAGNVGLKNPTEAEFLQSEAFVSLKCAVNRHDLRVTDPKSGTYQPCDHDATESLVVNCEENPSERPIEIDGTKSSTPRSRSSESPPKCSTPIRKSPPKLESPCSHTFSLDHCTQSDSSISDISLNTSYAPAYKKRKIRKKVEAVMGSAEAACLERGETLSDAIAQSCLFQRKTNIDGKEIISHVFSEVARELGVQKTFNELIPEELWTERVHLMSVPDWMLLLCKLESKISDDAWQMILNRTKLGKSGNSSDTPVLLSKSSMKALRTMVFGKVRSLLNISEIEDPGIPGYQVSLGCAITWIIREMRLHGQRKDEIQLNLKLDGRPFFGRNQVLIGVVPMETPFLSNQSCKSVCPLAIANCKEDRESLKKLIVNLNKQKNVLKKNGIMVDGSKHTVKFKVILDLKALYLLLAKDGDENFQLGKRGIEVEFCFICNALRGCSCDLGPHTICLEHFSLTKANIGGFSGIRDDLEFLLEEDLSSINLCALHCELRNTEQLLASLGLFAFKVDSLDECNAELASYGPENFSSRITIKMKQGQETAVEKHNVQVSSFSGCTEREFLANIEAIVRNSLPHEKLKVYFAEPEIAKMAILHKVTFCSDRVKYYQDMVASDTFLRDFGSKQEKITLTGSEVGKEVQRMLEFWQKKLHDIEGRYMELSENGMSGKQRGKKRQKVANSDEPQLSDYAAEVVYEFFLKVYTEWRDIAQTLRNRVFREDQQHLIDNFDIQCKEWGFLLREMFGCNLGTGDYGHITIEHASMLLRNFLSLRDYSNQGFEAAHSLQRQLYSKATSHDRHGHATSIQQMLQHFFSEKFLFMRLCFKMASQSMANGKPFHFRGCGWSKNKMVMWSNEDMAWIASMNDLFTRIFGDDFLVYKWDKGLKRMTISPDCFPDYEYDHALWEETFSTKVTSSTCLLAQPQSPSSSPATSLATSPSTSHTSSGSPATSPASSLATSSATSSPTNPAALSLPSNFTPGSSVFFHATSGISYSEDLRVCASNNSTRGRIATLNLPPVMQIADNNIQLVICPERLNNPLQLTVRPSESALTKSYQLVSRASGEDIDDDDDDDDNIAVKVGDLGVFNCQAMDIWTSASKAASTKRRVQEEENWLHSSSSLLTASQIQEIRTLLFDSKPQEEILRIGDVFVDANDLSTLAAERYLLGFVIDAACLKYSEEAESRGSQSLYLPSFTQTWASSTNLLFLKSKLKPYLSGRNLSAILWILTPVHVNGNHWGLLCLNMLQQQVFYDDGLKQNYPLNIPEIVENLIKAVSCSSEAKWDIALPLERFGMPKQPLFGEGCASCGVGVILATHDFLNTADPRIPQFHWQFHDMKKHRLRLLHQFTQWK